MFPTLDEVRAYAAEGRYRRVPVCMELLADRVGYFSYDYVKYAEPRACSACNFIPKAS